MMVLLKQKRSNCITFFYFLVLFCRFLRHLNAVSKKEKITPRP